MYVPTEKQKARMALSSDEYVIAAMQRSKVWCWPFYLCTLGLFEPWRRTAVFAVTNKRVLLVKGLVLRHTRSAMLRNVQQANVMTVPIGGFIRLQTGGGPGSTLETGPFTHTDALRMTGQINSMISGEVTV